MFLLQLLHIFLEDIGKIFQCFPFKYFKTTKIKVFFFGSISPDIRKRISSLKSYQVLSIFVSYTSSRVKMSVDYRCDDTKGILQNIKLFSQSVDKCVVSSSFSMWYYKIVVIRLQRVEFTCHLSSIFVAHKAIRNSIKRFFIHSVFWVCISWALKISDCFP